MALIARYGAAWFRTVGTSDCPGTALLTVTGRWAEPRVIEVALGTPFASALRLRPDEARGIQGVLLGGYGGGWLTTAEAMTLPLLEEPARQLGTSIGSGVVALLPTGVCPLAEVSRVVGYLEGEGAGQCGPCVNGLAALASAVERLASHPSTLRGGIADIPALCTLVEGRGACRHPDGVARFVRSAAPRSSVTMPPSTCSEGPVGSGPLGPPAPARISPAGETMKRVALVVDPIACDGHGVCAELFPEGVSLDPWGFPIVVRGEIPDDLLEHAERAVAGCPRLALVLAAVERSA